MPRSSDGCRFAAALAAGISAAPANPVCTTGINTASNASAAPAHRHCGARRRRELVWFPLVAPGIKDSGIASIESALDRL
jgi:hypothetical protein